MTPASAAQTGQPNRGDSRTVAWANGFSPAFAACTRTKRLDKNTKRVHIALSISITVTGQHTYETHIGNRDGNRIGRTGNSMHRA